MYCVLSFQTFEWLYLLTISHFLVDLLLSWLEVVLVGNIVTGIVWSVECGAWFSSWKICFRWAYFEILLTAFWWVFIVTLIPSRPLEAKDWGFPCKTNERDVKNKIKIIRSSGVCHDLDMPLVYWFFTYDNVLCIRQMLFLYIF